MTCEPCQVVIVPFPFTDRSQTKGRPAIVVSQTRFNRRGHSILSMITSAATYSKTPKPSPAHSP